MYIQKCLIFKEKRKLLWLEFINQKFVLIVWATQIRLDFRGLFLFFCRSNLGWSNIPFLLLGIMMKQVPMVVRSMLRFLMMGLMFGKLILDTWSSGTKLHLGHMGICKWINCFQIDLFFLFLALIFNIVALVNVF